jgi:predicted small lipoprotein YifL
MLMAAAAVLTLAACGQQNPLGGGIDPNDPNAPSKQTPQATSQQAQLTQEQRDQLESLVRGYVDTAQQQMAAGWRPAAGTSDIVDAMQPGADHREQVQLRGGTAYRIVGACDNECSNVDIELLDGRGAVVASDMLPDDIPLVNYTPAADGRYTVRMLMQTCTVAPCYAGARVLTGGEAENK